MSRNMVKTTYARQFYKKFEFIFNLIILRITVNYLTYFKNIYQFIKCINNFFLNNCYQKNITILH